jgi:hypothetical protein
MKFHYFIWTGILLFTNPFFAFSQENFIRYNLKFENANSIQLELLGHGLGYSLNYEYLFLNDYKLKTTLQAGIAYYLPNTGFIGLWVPVSVNEVISFYKHHLELGIGLIFNKDRIEYDKWNNKFGSFRIGYRYQKADSNYLFRFGFTPFIEYEKFPNGQTFIDFHPWAGIAYGYSF